MHVNSDYLANERQRYTGRTVRRRYSDGNRRYGEEPEVARSTCRLISGRAGCLYRVLSARQSVDPLCL